MTPSSRVVGRVALVGAGPGDPGLITVAGLERLRAADVVVYDALANPRLLGHARPGAKLLDVGKRAGAHRFTQDQINALLLDEARQGHVVVRLKGGDPYLFGRGAEEAAYLGRHGVEVEVIPGVTSGIAAPAAAGIPVTHREHASTVTFVTGHEDPTKPGTSIDYAALAGLIRAGGTACIYMGVGRLPAIRDQLTGHGLSDTTPAAVVQWGTLPTQRQIRGTLATIVSDIERAGIEAPAMIVVGAVAAIDEPGLDGFTRRPLFGQTVLVTRTRQQASALRVELERLGAQVIEAPTIEVVPPASWDAVDERLRRLGSFDVVALTSANAVDVLADRLDALGLDARALAGRWLAVVGAATRGALRARLGVRADIYPERTDGQGLAEAILAEVGERGTALLLRADIARPELPRVLAEAGWRVDEAVAYETRPAPSLPEEALDALRARRVKWVAFTSSSTATNLALLLGDERALLEGVRLASIGPNTSATVRELGLPVAVEAPEASVTSLARAMAEQGRD